MEMKKIRRKKKRNLAQSRERKRLVRLRGARKKSCGVFNSDFVDQIRVLAPQKFALEGEYHDNLVKFLASLRDAFLQENKIVTIDFRKTNLVVAGGTLLFFSELQRLKSIFPLVPLHCIPSKDDAVNQTLEHIRIYELCGYKSHVVPTRQDVICWKAASAATVDGSRVGGVIETYSSLSGDLSKHLFRGATEAMLNSMNHAYMEDRRDGLPAPTEKNWWMFCRQTDEDFIVALCDLGIGIPRSLPIKYPLELIENSMMVLSRGKIKTDARLIQAAMELARTRTNRKGRGLGLHDLKKIVDKVEGGSLHLFSNRGLVSYRNGQFARENFQRSIKGTVVVWKIPLKENTHE